MDYRSGQTIFFFLPTMRGIDKACPFFPDSHRSLVNADNVMDCMHVYAMPGRDDSVIEDKDFASDV